MKDPRTPPARVGTFTQAGHALGGTRRPGAWSRYEAAKRDLPADLTPEQYEAACRAIAKRLGV